MGAYTPELNPSVLERLTDYANGFADLFPHSRPALWAGVYRQGLLLDGERKSIEPLSRRVRLPDELPCQDPEQALQQFVNQSPWDEQPVQKRYRSQMAPTFASEQGLFLIDDTSFPKSGSHSVGVARQYCEALGKRANCQVAVSIHYTTPRAHYPLAMRLYLPEAWLDDEARLEKTAVPKEFRDLKTKGEIALELLDQVRSEGLPGKLVVADAGYGVSDAFRQGLQDRRLRYIVGLTGPMVVFTQEPTWTDKTGRRRGGRKAKRPRLAEESVRPMTLAELAKQVPLHKVTWRQGSKGKMKGQFAWMRVWLAGGWERGLCAGAGPVWLLIEKTAEGEYKFAVSNLPKSTSRLKAVRLWKSRWPIEQGYQQMKEEMGLDHLEGRSWRGFHHHLTMVMLAFGFLLLEKHYQQEHSTESGKKGVVGRS